MDFIIDLVFRYIWLNPMSVKRGGRSALLVRSKIESIIIKVNEHGMPVVVTLNKCVAILTAHTFVPEQWVHRAVLAVFQANSSGLDQAHVVGVTIGYASQQRSSCLRSSVWLWWRLLDQFGVFPWCPGLVMEKLWNRCFSVRKPNHYSIC